MSDLEANLLFQIRAINLPDPEQQYVFAKPRKWAFDLCWPDYMWAVECEGGLWVKGRHNRPEGMKKDMDKYNAAALLGWKLLRFSADHIKSGEALATIEKALETRNET